MGSRGCSGLERSGVLLTLAAIGILYSLRMLPIIQLEVLYMLIWLTVLAVLPWRYGVAHCVTKRGDQGRLDRARPAEGQP